MLFTPKRPAPLQHDPRGLSHVELVDPTYNSSSSSATDLVAVLDEERMGLPPYLARYLHTHYGTLHGQPPPARQKGNGSSHDSLEARLTVVQSRILLHLYAKCDAAVCAPTGSGKTFAACVGVIAKLMRDGPMKLFSTLILVNHDHLCLQVEQWLRELWWYPDDNRLVFAATTDIPENVIYRRLTRELVKATGPDVAAGGAGRVIGVEDHRPYIVVSTPEVMWRFVARRRRAIAARKGGHKHSYALTPVIPTLDLLVVDEVDEVLPLMPADAAGRLLMKELCRRIKYQAPIHCLFTSATLAGSVVNRLKPFLKRHLLEDYSSRLFSVRGERDDRTARGSTGVAVVPEGVHHLFYTADTAAERLECFSRLLSRSSDPRSDELGEDITASASGGCSEAMRSVLVVLDDNMKAEEVKGQLLEPACKAVLDGLSPPVTYTFQCLDRSIDHNLALRRSAERRDYYRRTHSLHPSSSGSSSPSKTPISPLPSLHPASTSSIPPTPAAATIQFLLSRRSYIRGMDLKGLTHVVLLAQPGSCLEYTHWCGRVGRLGRRGTCATILPRSAARHLHGFCNALGLPFNVERRHSVVNINEAKGW